MTTIYPKILLTADIIQKLNDNWDKHTENYFNAIKYLNKYYIYDFDCRHCFNQNNILDEIYFRGLFAIITGDNLTHFYYKDMLICVKLCEVYILYPKCPNCNKTNDIHLINSNIYIIFTNLYNYSIDYQNYILDVKITMLFGRFSDNSPFSREYMPRDVFKLIWKYVYYYKLDKINDKLDNEINKIKTNKNKSIFGKVIEFFIKN